MVQRLRNRLALPAGTVNLPTSSSGVAVWIPSVDPGLGAELCSGDKSRRGDIEDASRD